MFRNSPNFCSISTISALSTSLDSSSLLSFTDRVEFSVSLSDSTIRATLAPDANAFFNWFADLPPPQWDIHDCWVSHQTQKGINKKLNEHYKRCGIKPLFEKNILIKRESFKKKFVGKTNRECSSDLVVKGEVNRVGWFIIHSIYKKYAILNGDKFFVIRLWYKNKSISCLIRGSIIERRILKKREKYFVMLSSFVYDDKNYVYISKLIKPCLIDVSITECKELFFNDW